MSILKKFDGSPQGWAKFAQPAKKKLDFDHEFSYFTKNQGFLVKNDGLGYTYDISIVKPVNKAL